MEKPNISKNYSSFYALIYRQLYSPLHVVQRKE